MARDDLSDGKSHKFWAASVEGEELTTNWGRIGTDGQSKTKSLGSSEAADKELAKLIRAKTKKGYVLVSESAAAAKPAAAKPAATKPAEPDPEPAEPILSDLPDESVANTAGLEKHMPVTRGAVKP
ncbi:MAG: WGR domain-containing protein, partial [Polyangiales bacterium]